MSSLGKLPTPGDIVWCLFPELPELNPGPKPRPALVFGVTEKTDGAIVRVVYGTSKQLSKLKTGEVSICKAKSPEGYRAAGLSYDTKFNMKAIVDLPWTERFFRSAPGAPYGVSPKIGTLHASLVRTFALAYEATKTRN
jgi:hypothetical protein